MYLEDLYWSAITLHYCNSWNIRMERSLVARLVQFVDVRGICLLSIYLSSLSRSCWRSWNSISWNSNLNSLWGWFVAFLASTDPGVLLLVPSEVWHTPSTFVFDRIDWCLFLFLWLLYVGDLLVSTTGSTLLSSSLRLLFLPLIQFYRHNTLRSFPVQTSFLLEKMLVFLCIIHQRTLTISATCCWTFICCPVLRVLMLLKTHLFLTSQEGVLVPLMGAPALLIEVLVMLIEILVLLIGFLALQKFQVLLSGFSFLSVSLQLVVSVRPTSRSSSIV